MSRDASEPGDDARWLRAHLGEGKDRVSFGSVPKLKGIEADAIVLTDAGPEARDWAEETGLDWDDMMYVALSRAKYDAIVLEPRGNDEVSPG